jgi:hypothetical protein
MPVAEERALRALSRHPVPASSIATHIWPGHRMKAQGAGAAASRVLKRLERQGRARWTANNHCWGWIRTASHPKETVDAHVPDR